jgi:NitT/TauT family transport system substrate-binding protein
MSPVLASAVPRRNMLKFVGGTITAGALMGTSGCGLLGGSTSANQQPKGNLEKGSIKVAIQADTAVAPLYLAQQAGYFQQEGLQVQIIQAASGPAALNGMIGGDYDIAYSSYVPFFAAQAKGVAPLKIVADAGSAPPHSFMMMTSPTSEVKTPQDLAGKTIAVSDVNTTSDLLVKATMRAYGVDFSQVNWARTPFPNMPGAIAQKRVDAAAVTEPFVTLSQRNGGALPVVDIASGPTQDFPLTGYGVTAKYAQENPNTIKAFQRAQARATADAQDRGKIQPLLVTADKVDPQTAALMTLLNFRSTADATRLQRVTQLMREFGIIDKDIDVPGMIVPQQPS